MKLRTLGMCIVAGSAIWGCSSDDSADVASGGAGGAGGGTAASAGAAGTGSAGASGSGTGGAGGSATGGGAGTGSTGASGGVGGTGATGSGGNAGGVSCTGGASAGGACGNDGSAWPTKSQGFECQVIDLLNAKRKTGVQCGTTFAPAVPELARNQILTENARAHSEDMAMKKYVDLTEPGGIGPIDWSMKNYCGTYITAEVAGGQSAPSIFLATLMNIEQECLKLMGAGGKGIGVGYYTDVTGTSVHMWTLVVGSAP